MKIPLLQWLLQGIPESLAIVYLAIALAGQKPETWKILLLGIIDAVIIYLIRLLPLTFGVHSILQILVIAFLLHLFFKVSFGKSLFSALTVIITLAVTETVFFALFMSLIGLSFEELSKNIFLYIIGGWPQIILLFILALAVNRKQQKTKTCALKGNFF